ncbi:chemotaxis protein CheD [Gymnodinialimonas ceratoperidinii]|uniref:Probable chemoreceptor glutamine deamidase CheD n=1 Tax=Gymnodinialimonas ceratoperidinii TaxID=2856823 RepID=A0A8F6YEF7_9RHOB|nr:chemotaxis protein CheD [Gymnodinialimonas ceratoperidinii]QXT41182.1 chemotaxis protein CheD [Gymnodinialimonas ceratoperidinii]
MINVSDPRVVHVLQGQVVATAAPSQILTTILGSCISACMRDPVLRLGGMNHFLLPGDDPRKSNSIRYGARSMEELINALLRKGAARDRLEVWLFGGADLLRMGTGVGEANCAFATAFVETEGFSLRGTDLGGSRGRRVRFCPYTGEISIRLMQTAPVERRVAPRMSCPDVELF